MRGVSLSWSVIAWVVTLSSRVLGMFPWRAAGATVHGVRVPGRLQPTPRTHGTRPLPEGGGQGVQQLLTGPAGRPGGLGAAGFR